MENVIPTNPDARRETMLTYYQWVPFILLFMAILFKLPRILWKALTFSSAISLDKVNDGFGCLRSGFMLFIDRYIL